MTKAPAKQNLEPFNAFALAPEGLLYAYYDPDEALLQTRFFSDDPSFDLLHLGLIASSEALPVNLVFWRAFAQLFISELCRHTHSDHAILALALPQAAIQAWLQQAPFMRGCEYLNLDVANQLWQGLLKTIQRELMPFNGNLTAYLATFHHAWSTVGRVCFHLAENKNHPTLPFAFLATYTTRLDVNTKPLHIPLSKALENTAGLDQHAALLSLLLPVQRAAEHNSFIKQLVDSSQIFKALAWNAHDAHQFLRAIPQCEAAGVIIRVPNWWQKPAKVGVNVTVGAKASSQVGLAALLDFDVQIALPNGDTLSSAELKELLACSESLVYLKGQWVEIDATQLNQVLKHWRSLEQHVKQDGLSFAEGLRLLAGTSKVSGDLSPEVLTEWSTVIEGQWLKQALNQLRQPEALETHLATLLKKSLNATLRPYQNKGVMWLWWLYQLRLGGCLADDMGLGKTIQVIGLLLLVKARTNPTQPHLLVIPASLLGNWQAELARFAPSLNVYIAHGSLTRTASAPLLTDIDLVITTYGTFHRLAWLAATTWDIVILDEAQAIKNPTARQTRALKNVKSQVRFALTGTPIENSLIDLWSLFDFIAPGLLGASKAFSAYSKQKTAHPAHFSGAVRRLVTPYILRRLKSDKKIISDLPAKTEILSYCSLSTAQVKLYQQSVEQLTQQLQHVEGIKRRGLVLSYLMRFKQICNHPSQWLGHGSFEPNLSGKFIQLKALCDVISAKHEKVLVFTQFREIIPALSDFLSTIFKQPGLTLDGQTPIKERSNRVAQFQQPQGPPFFVLSLKAGGTGLNLTHAAHVIHFDRWWNPAVENQATDRAFRIGQKNPVMVHKFLCLGTIEEKIELLLNTKKTLSDDILGSNNEVVLTELSNDALLSMVSLDIHRVMLNSQEDSL